ncbi:MAG: hypothetical protein HY040_22380 [Planctomycetes bacterium]|nr:hypothetical protein [Planctomycetota bacterium]
MSDPVWIALIGVLGTVVGAVATILVARIQAAQKAGPPAKVETTPVLGEAVDIRELRLLRALYGEPKGRILEGYKAQYYGPALNAVMRKGWVKRIEKRYYMTPKGSEFCRTYLKELFGAWQPADQVLS